MHLVCDKSHVCVISVGQLIRKLIEVGDNARSAKGKGDKKVRRTTTIVVSYSMFACLRLSGCGSCCPQTASTSPSATSRRQHRMANAGLQRSSVFCCCCSVAVRPDVLVTGLVGEDCTLFTSKLYPLLASFNTPNGGTFKVQAA